MPSIVMTPAQEFVFQRTYARWLPEKGRRETWAEMVERYFTFFEERFGDKVPKTVWTKLRHRFLTMGTMPSMRAAWAAGPALASNHITAYNCCSHVIKDLRSFAENFYILMCGTGVGFSVEHEYIDQLPPVKKQTGLHMGTFVVPDSREGWADAVLAGLEAWFDGKDIDFDFSKVRPRGARLKTMGGRASGPEPLKQLLEFIREVVLAAQGRQLTSLECLDICNMEGEVTEVGGVRRAAEISFSDLDDELIRFAKHGAYPRYRGQSNNSAVYKTKPDEITFLREWTALVESHSGERGIFNLEAAGKASPRRQKFLEGDRRLADLLRHLRTNPCGEINLIALLGEFCNVSEVVVRGDDTFDDLIEKVEAAVWFGAMQAALTDFPYIRPSFREICEKERLLGVSLTGQMDNPALMTPEKLQILKEYAIKVAKRASKALGINMSAAITTGKPSGTVSQLVNCSSGAHPRFAKFYIRRYRISGTDALFRMMRDQGCKFTPENGQSKAEIDAERAEYLQGLLKQGWVEEVAKAEAMRRYPEWTEESVTKWVVSFVERAPEGCLTRHDVTAIDQLEWYLKVKQNWCEHNQSITVYVRDGEWMKVGNWVYEHFDEISGVTFLPYDGGVYKQMPYEEIDEETYNRLLAEQPKVDYTALALYEDDDNTIGARTYACSASGCELA